MSETVEVKIWDLEGQRLIGPLQWLKAKRSLSMTLDSTVMT